MTDRSVAAAIAGSRPWASIEMSATSSARGAMLDGGLGRSDLTRAHRLAFWDWTRFKRVRTGRRCSEQGCPPFGYDAHTSDLGFLF